MPRSRRGKSISTTPTGGRAQSARSIGDSKQASERASPSAWTASVPSLPLRESTTTRCATITAGPSSTAAHRPGPNGSSRSSPAGAVGSSRDDSICACQAQPTVDVGKFVAVLRRRDQRPLLRVAVEPYDPGVDGVEVEQHGGEADQAQPGGAAAPPAGGGARVQVGGEDRPDDERPGLLGVPAPVPAPGGLRPDGAGHDREGPDREAEGGGLEGQVV